MATSFAFRKRAASYLMPSKSLSHNELVRPAGFEPATFCSGGKWREDVKGCVCIAKVRSLPLQANFGPTGFDKAPGRPFE